MDQYDSKNDTLEHIKQVGKFMSRIISELFGRKATHDRSKLGPEEKPFFDEHTPKLRTLTYGSEEYRQSLEALKPALDHHYANNSHHPEHYANGIAGMDLLDLVEMYCDWKAASMRTKDGDFIKSIEIGIERFKIEPQLASILRNSVDVLKNKT